MKTYYVYAQTWSNLTMASCYNAYTDNEFLMREYIKELETILRNSSYIGSDILSDVYTINKVSDEDELMKIICKMEIGSCIYKDNRLWSTSCNDLSQFMVVANDAIYSRFIETIVVRDEIRKIDANIYRLCHPANLSSITGYLRDGIAEDILQVAKLLYDGHKRIKEMSNQLNYGELLDRKSDNSLWAVLNEGVELMRFMEMDILKIFKFFSAPFV